jgi:hypothetical protein
MATTLSSPPLPLPGLRDHQATLNVEKILDTINNLVRILELTLTINLAPSPSPPTPPVTVILPKATTLGSGLDQVSPQSASELYSKVLTDHITSITKWAKAVTSNTPPTCMDGPLPPTPPQPSSVTTPALTGDAKRRKAKAEHRKAQRQCRKAASPPASPAPPVGPAFLSARPANLGTTHPPFPIGPAALSAALASLGLTCAEPLFLCCYLTFPPKRPITPITPITSAPASLAPWPISLLGTPRPTSPTPLPASRPPSTASSVQAPQPPTVWTSMFPTYGLDGILRSPTPLTAAADPVPNWDDEDTDWDGHTRYPLQHPLECGCGKMWGHDSFHSPTRSRTVKCSPHHYPPPPTPMPEYMAPDCPNPQRMGGLLV